MSHDRFEAFSRHVEKVVTNHPEKVPGFGMVRSTREGWFIARGPDCNFFVGVSTSRDGDSWIVSGPVVRRTILASDAESGFSESYRYALVPADRERLSATSLAERDKGEWWDHFEELHTRAFESLERDDLLYDGWIVWEGESRGTVVTLPSTSAV